MTKSMHSLRTLALASVALMVSFSVLSSLTISTVHAYSAANVASFAGGDNGNENEEHLYLTFTYKMYFEDVPRAELYEFTKEIPNDDLWCMCSQTWVITEGSGEHQIGRQWEQYYSFAGLQDHIIYTRQHLEENTQHSWTGKGVFADIGSDYLFSDLPNGGTLLTFNAVYKINFPVAPEQVLGLLEALRQMYEGQFITYFGSTGHVELNDVNVFYL